MKTLNKIKQKQKYSLLSFDDIEMLLEFYKHNQYLNELKEILEKEITKRPYCVEKLYEYNDFLNEKFKYKKPNPNDLRDVLREKFDAIILDEYRKQYNKISDDYINKRINYEQHLRNKDKIDKKTLRLLFKVKIIYQNERN
jgi:hypothetical protein